jgi:integrase
MPRAKRGQNDGSKVYPYTRGGFYAQVSIGGKRIAVYGQTKDEVKAKRADLLVKIGKGLISAPDKLTLGEWLDRWLAMKKPHLAEGSHRDYTLVLARGIPENLRKMRLQAVKRTHVKQLEVSLTMDGMGVRSRGKVFQYLRAAFEEAIEQELIALNPARGIRVKATQAEEQARGTASDKALTEDEMFSFLDAAKGDPLYAVLYTLFTLGVRRGEALGLSWKGLNLNTGVIEVAQQVKVARVEGKMCPVLGVLKTKNSRRTLYGSADLLEVLRAHKAVQDEHRRTLGKSWTETGLVFTTSLGTMIHPDNVNRTIARICERSGIRHFSSHTGRHTAISHALRDGEKLEVVSAIAGHARPSITADLYRTVFEDEKRSAVYSIAERRSRRPRAVA